MKKIILLTACLLCSFFTQAVTVYVGGPSASLPSPWPPRGQIVGTPQYMADINCSEYIYCIGSSVKASKYTEYTCRVKCDYRYKYADGFDAFGNDVYYFESGTEYYDVVILPVNITAPSSMTLNVGDQKSINWSYSPSSVSKPKVEWSTSNYSVAYVNSSDYIIANGSGVAYITGKNNAGPNVEIKVTVNDVPVTSVTVSAYSIYADQTKTLSVSVTPSNATVKTKEWYSADASIASINRNTGDLTGVWPGKTKVWCVVNGTITSNEAEVTVTEPSFSFKEFSLPDNATEVETKPTLSAEFSHALTRGDNYNDIALTDGNGQRVDGTLTISGTKLTFTPSKHLLPTTNYTWTIPTQAVKNKWGTPFWYSKKLSFTTTDWKQMTLTVQPDVKYIARGDQIVLTCSAPDASIYYSTDGSMLSKLYTGSLTFEDDMTLQAIAKLDGYYDSPRLTHVYLRSVEIAERFPGENPLYNYADVNPYIVFSQQISQGTQFNGISMKKDGYEAVACEVLIHDNTLFFVPVMPLEQGCAYKVSLPESALVTVKGEANKAVEWTFATGDYATAVSIGGPELTAAIKTDGSLWTWGKRITEANAEDGSYCYTTQTEPNRFIAGDVVAVSSGYMHHAVIKRDGSLWMWGRQLCGEFGNGSTAASAQPVKIMDGVKSVSCGLQTTAIVKQDGTLWMCGRNDLGQIDDTRTVHTSYIKVADGVSRVQLNWGSIDIEKSDGTTATRTWDTTADEQRQPADAHIDNVAEVAYGWHSAVALRDDGSVWTWGQNSNLSEVIEGRNPQPAEGITLLSEQLQLKTGERWLIAHRPRPLLADYTALTWESDNTAVATVSDRGLVSGLTDGTATVTATMSDERGQRYEAKCKVTVGNPSGISNILGDGWRLHVSVGGRQLLVSGVPEGQQVSIYNYAGACLWLGRMPKGKLIVPVSLNGVYLVRTARQVKKVAVH